MALTETQLNEILKIFRNENFKYENFYVKLYTGNPGSAGTENAATEATRKAATFGAPASKKTSISAAIEWVSVSTNETYKYLGFWSAAAAGTFYGSVALEAEKAVSAGDTFKLASGEGLSITAA